MLRRLPVARVGCGRALVWAGCALCLWAAALGSLAQVAKGQALGAARPTATAAPLASPGTQPSLHLKIKDDLRIGLSGGTFTGAGAAAVNRVLAASGAALVRRLVRESVGVLRRRRSLAEARAGRRLADMSNYYEVGFRGPVDLRRLARRLEQLPAVEAAYPAPRPAPPPTADFSGMETYLGAAPEGLDSGFARRFPGGDGAGAKIIDVEYAWDTQHEDLASARDAFVPNGTPVDSYRDHGTAVLGEIAADDNGYGVTGLLPAVKLELINVENEERGWDLVNALVVAEGTSKPGDVILIEQQASYIDLIYMPVEWIDAVYDEIALLTSRGYIVVEAAGNGGQDLDEVRYGSPFPNGKPDSGAIIVGAGQACSGGVLRSRFYQSNYGARVDLQGQGSCVTTTGYGDLSNDSPHATYTSLFGGTSSASPMVAAAAASVSSAYRTLNGRPPTPAQVRDVLVATGTPQSTDGPAGHIGPQPNLAAALRAIDRRPPSAVFTGGEASSRPGASVAFDAGASSDPDGSLTDWAWDFGDGATATGQHVSHTYISGGRYPVTLTVRNDRGLDATARRTVVVVPEKPTRLLARSGPRSVTVSWDPVAGATSYRAAYWYTDTGGAGPPVPDLSATSITIPTTRAIGVRITAKAGDVAGPESDAIIAAPAPVKRARKPRPSARCLRARRQLAVNRRRLARLRATHHKTRRTLRAITTTKRTITTYKRAAARSCPRSH